jgi:dCTP deaminase
MTLSRQALLARMSENIGWNKRLTVEPFFDETEDEENESVSASLDFHLGNRFTLLRGRRAAQHDPLSEDPRQDIVPREVFIPMGSDFALRPGQIVLGTTLEWFRFPLDLMAYVIGRSIWGRRGLLIVTAQAVHPGSTGTITLEMSNLGEVGLRLKPGTAIGQLFFHRIEDAPLDTEIEGASLDTDNYRRSNYSGAHRPILGKYSRTKVERLLLEL